MFTLCTNHESEFEIEYLILKGNPGDFHQKAYPDEVEFISISIYEVKLTTMQMELFITDYGADLLETLCLEDAINTHKENF